MRRMALRLLKPPPGRAAGVMGGVALPPGRAVGVMGGVALPPAGLPP